jgi:glycosyltransferase involved in cell wall biosynthesis
MKIIVVMTYNCHWSGVIAKDLQEMGHDVHVFDIIGRPETGLLNSKISGIRDDFNALKNKIANIHLVHTNVHSNFRYILAAPKLRKLAKSIKADIILSLYGGGFATMAYLSGFRPYAVYIVGSDILLSDGYKKIINRLTLTSSSQVFTNGEYLAQQTKRQAPYASIMPLLIGTNLEDIPIAEHRTGTVQIICTRGFESVYNNEAIINAIALLPHECPDFRMVFVSGGELLQHSISLADSILPPEIRRKVVFWRGVSFNQVLDGLKNSHIFISMSRSDGTATSLLEAMGAGLFPILSNIPQNRTWIDPEKENGILVPLDDNEALSNAMLMAIKKAAFLGMHAEYNRSLIREKADSKKNHKILEQRLKEIVYAR